MSVSCWPRQTGLCLLRRFVPIPVWLCPLQGAASPHSRVALMALSALLVTLMADQYPCEVPFTANT